MNEREQSTALAPVVLFTYKRLSTTRRVVDALRANPEAARSPLIVFSDGPKGAADVAKVDEVRAYLRDVAGFASVELIVRDQNLGLSKSFIRGITEILAIHEKAIFVEDDNLVSPLFLRFMNDALIRYQDDERVICVTGYSFPLWPQRRSPYFLRGAETWSMGTWRRGWNHFRADGKQLLAELEARGLIRLFRRDGFGFYEMLQQQIRGENDSWGVRWWTSAFVANKYCLYPPEPLCVSIGYGDDSVHCGPGWVSMYRTPEELGRRPVIEFPDKVHESLDVSLSVRGMNLDTALRRRFRSLKKRLLTNH